MVGDNDRYCTNASPSASALSNSIQPCLLALASLARIISIERVIKQRYERSRSHRIIATGRRTSVCTCGMNPFRSIVMFAVARCQLQSSAALASRSLRRGTVGGYNPRPRSAQIFSLAPQHLLASRDTSSEINRRQLVCRQTHRRASSNGCNDDQRKEGLLQSSTPLLLGNILPFVGKAAISVGTIGVGILALLYFKQGNLYRYGIST